MVDVSHIDRARLPSSTVILPKSNRSEVCRLARGELCTVFTREDARRYIERWPDYRPDYFDPNRVDDDFELAFAPQSWAWRHERSLLSATHYTLYVDDLGLSAEYEKPDFLLERTDEGDRFRKVWREAIKKHFKRTAYFSFDLTEGGRVHVHVIADADDGPGSELFRRTQENAKPCAHYFRQIIRYLLEPFPYNALTLWLWRRATHKSGIKVKLPKLSGTLRLPRHVSVTPPLLFIDGLKQPPPPLPEGFELQAKTHDQLTAEEHRSWEQRTLERLYQDQQRERRRRRRRLKARAISATRGG